MLEKYSVYCDGQDAGMIRFEREGLYYSIYGKLTLAKNKIWRIIAVSAVREIDLGICLYEDPHFILRKKLPIKCFDDTQWDFKAICPSDQKNKIIPVSEDQPFDQLDRIEEGAYSTENGSGIILDSDH